MGDSLGMWLSKLFYTGFFDFNINFAPSIPLVHISMGNEYHSFSPKLKWNLMVRLTKGKKIHICLLPHLLQILGEQTKTLWFLQQR